MDNLCHTMLQKGHATYLLFFEDTPRKDFPNPSPQCYNKFAKARRHWSIPHNGCWWFLSNTAQFLYLKVNNVKKT